MGGLEYYFNAMFCLIKQRREKKKEEAKQKYFLLNK